MLKTFSSTTNLGNSSQQDLFISKIRTRVRLQATTIFCQRAFIIINNKIVDNTINKWKAREEYESFCIHSNTMWRVCVFVCVWEAYFLHFIGKEWQSYSCITCKCILLFTYFYVKCICVFLFFPKIKYNWFWKTLSNNVWYICKKTYTNVFEWDK